MYPVKIYFGHFEQNDFILDIYHVELICFLLNLGIDATYENHRRGFHKLGSITDDIYTILKRNGNNNLVELTEKVKEGLSLSSSYILGHYSYNVSFNDACKSHCINYACSNPKDHNQRVECNDASDGKHDEKNDCDHCNLLPGLIYNLEKLIDEIKDDLSDITYREMRHDTAKAFEDIQLYKKQVMRNVVSSSTWEEHYKRCSKSLDMITIDFAMKCLPRKARETQVSVQILCFDEAISLPSQAV